MNPETLIADVAEMIKAVNEQGLLRCHICYWEGKVQILARQHTDKRHHVFFLLNEYMLRNGLTNQEWAKLKRNLANFFKEKI